jgi:hypothetical protein
MHPKTGDPLLRAAALASIVGGVLWGVKVLIDGFSTSARFLEITDAPFFVAPLLMAAGLAGIHTRYSSRIRGMGRTGFVNGFIGLALLAVGLAGDLSFGVEEAVRISSFAFLILAFGLVLLGLEVLKVAALPRWNFVPLAMGLLVPLSVISGDAALLRAPLSALFGIGWVLLGLVLLSDTAGSE